MGALTAAVPAPRPRARPRDWIAFAIMVVGLFMAFLDIQIVASSLPQVQAGLSASADEIVWVQTAYLVAEVVMIPLSGWLTQVMSTRLLFVCSCIGFTLMSLACGLAWDMDSMILFRTLQGFIGGAMIPTVFATNYKLFPPEQQGLGTVLVGVIATTAPTFGPTLGGWLTEIYGWEWIFWVNIVPGIVVAFGVWFLMADIDRPNWRLLRKVDFLGIVLVAAFLGSLEIVLEEGPRHDWFETAYIVWFAVLSAGSGIGLVWRELTIANPVVDLRTFADRNFAFGCILTFVVGAGVYGQVYILPQILSQLRGYNSLQIGQVIIVTGTFQFLAAPLAGFLNAKLDPRVTLGLGLLCCALGYGASTHLTNQVGFAQLFLPQALIGAGIVLAMIPITAAALGTLDFDKISGGSGLFNIVRNMGGAVGLALIVDHWDGRYDRHYWWLVERLTPDRAPVEDALTALQARYAEAGLAGAPADSAAQHALARMVSGEATIMAWNDIYVMMTVAFAATLLLLPLLRKPQQTAITAH